MTRLDIGKADQGKLLFALVASSTRLRLASAIIACSASMLCITTILFRVTMSSLPNPMFRFQRSTSTAINLENFTVTSQHRFSDRPENFSNSL
jgi:hypothetical protein